MASSQLLDINVDELFAQHSIGEIDEIHRRLLANVEEKREELRMMVGERYRDLLHAADTIGDMRQTSTTVIEHIEGIMTSCHRINDQQLIGFKLPPAVGTIDIAFDKTVTNYYGIVAQIRLLTVLPELIWSRLDTEDFFVATQLFILSRHISTGLQLETNSNLMRKFSVARRQWNILNQFFFTIKQLSLDTLERPELEVATAAKCLATLVLLENCPIDKLMSMFAQLRAKAFRNVIKPDEAIESHRSTQLIRDKILTGLKLLNETVSLMYQCFVASGDGTSLLDQQLKQITDPSAAPTISLIDMDDSAITSALPSMITKFKPHVQGYSLAPEKLQPVIQAWLRSTEKDSTDYFKALFNDVGSVRTIYGIKTAAIEIQLPSDWQVALQRLGLPPNLDFYQSYCQPLVRERTKDIITTSWEKTVDKTHEEVTVLLNNAELIWSNDCKSFCIEDPADMPTSLKEALSTDKRSHKLLMKTKGFSKEICQVCELFDSNIEILYNDLSLYLSAGISEQMPNKVNEEAAGDREKVIEFLRDCSEESVSRLITLVKSQRKEKTSQSNLIFLARLLKAFTVMCPNLKVCLTQTLMSTSNWDEPKPATTANQLEYWQRLCRLLDDEATVLWKQWVDLFIIDMLEEHNGLCFDTNLNFDAMLNIFLSWDAITVEEKDDQNQSFNSIIRIPSQPSQPLQQFLFKCCDRLNQSIPNTLPRPIIALVTESLADKLRLTYAKLLSDGEFIAGNQKMAVQIYFDLKFLNLLLSLGRQSTVGGDRRNNEDLSTLVNDFKAHIDPFDFEMSHKHINANVKKAIQRMRHQFGLLLPNYEHLSTLLTTTPATTVQDKEPSVLTLSVGATMTNMFPLLPIVIMSAASTSLNTVSPVKEQRTTKTEKAKARKSPQKSMNSQSTVLSAASSAQQNLANVKSNAAAFFGAMSQDWFR